MLPSVNYVTANAVNDVLLRRNDVALRANLCYNIFKGVMILEHLFELVTELLFGNAKHSPDKMPDDIAYKPDFIVKHPIRKIIVRIFASLVIIVTF